MAYTSIDDPTQNFNTVLYTGNSTAIGSGGHSITGVGFQPDFTWIKLRSGAANHILVDAVRGVTKNLVTNLSAGESTVAESLTAFGADGFTLGNNATVNENSDTYASWNWLAGNGTASNSNGSITSTVSANSAAGFSLVSYTGTGSNATVGHGLGVAPKMYVVKRRDADDSWWTFNSALGSNDAYLSLHSNAVSSTSGGSGLWNSTAPTSSVFSIGTNGGVNASSGTYIAYCFADVQGYSKFGSYTGNGNADGAFVNCGFEPAFVIIKGAVSGDGTAAQHWEMYDNKRNTFNPQDKALFPSLNSIESTESRINILSNGFKAIINSDGVNDNNSTYIFMAFAESPFVNSNGVPNDAR